MDYIIPHVKPNECRFCNKSFFNTNSKNIHLKTCSAKIEYHEKLLKEYEGKNKIQATNDINNNTTNNKNIVVNNFGEENTKYVRNKLVSRMLFHNNAAQVHILLTKMVYFNDKHPENHSIQIHNSNQGLYRIKKGNRVEIVDADFLALEISNNNIDFVNDRKDADEEQLEFGPLLESKCEEFNMSSSVENKETSSKLKKSILMLSKQLKLNTLK